MTPDLTKSAEKMKSAKAACVHAPVGMKQDAALKHCHAAEKAQTAMNVSETDNALDAAPHARVTSGA